MSLPKPMMRGMLAKRTRFQLPAAFFAAFSVAVAIKYGISEPRKRAYAEFYKEYDAVKEFNAMREAGVFESVQPTGK